MIPVYSKQDPTILLHILNKSVSYERKDISPVNEFLQVSCFKLKNNKTFRPHKHIYKTRNTCDVITQETWIIVEGSVKVTLYDLDDTVIHEDVLVKGDCTITFRGGHNYTSLSDNTLVYEVKTGPYEGRELDKTFIQ